jgi:AraC-like DNA-binding protein
MFFGFPIDEMEQLPSIHTVGWEWKEASNNYICDCRIKRWVNGAPYVIQYTVSGEGAIEIDGMTHRLPPGHAFFIEKPGPFCYFLPEDSSHWELKFIALSNVDPHWNKIIGTAGRIAEIGQSPEVLRVWDEIYRLAESKAFEDTFHNSLLAYRLLMELRRWTLRGAAARPTDIGPLEESLRWIDRNFHMPISLAELVKTTGFSRSYFMRQFAARVGETPMDYLTKVRIRHASQLLVQTKLSMEEIAERCGFSNGNYFAKVFRKLIGTSPRDFRENTGSQRTSLIHFL